MSGNAKNIHIYLILIFIFLSYASSTTCANMKKSRMPLPEFNEDRTKVLNLKELATVAADKNGIKNPLLFYAMLDVESNSNPTAISPDGAIGLAQLMPKTAEELNEDPFSISENINGGARYLKKQLEQFGTIGKALAAYNAGPGAVKKYDGIPPYDETVRYIDLVQKRYAFFLDDSGYGDIKTIDG